MLSHTVKSGHPKCKQNESYFASGETVEYHKIVSLFIYLHNIKPGLYSIKQ